MDKKPGPGKKTLDLESAHPGFCGFTRQGWRCLKSGHMVLRLPRGSCSCWLMWSRNARRVLAQRSPQGAFNTVGG